MKLYCYSLTFNPYQLLTMKEEIKYNLFIWKTKDWTYVFLEDAFKYESWLKGLTWFELEFHTDEDAEQSFEDLFDWEGFDFYIEYLKRTEDPNCTYYDRQEQVKSERDNDYDDSYAYLDCVEKALEYANNEENEDYTCTNCVWCWRHFDEENINADFYEYYIPENLELLKKLYNEYEK